MSHPHVPTRSPRREAGMTTSEYAAGTIGATSIALVLVHLAGNGTLLELVRPFLEIGLRDVPWSDALPRVRPFRGILR